MVTAVAYRLANQSQEIKEMLSEFRLTNDQLLEVGIESFYYAYRRSFRNIVALCQQHKRRTTYLKYFIACQSIAEIFFFILVTEFVLRCYFVLYVKF